MHCTTNGLSYSRESDLYLGANEHKSQYRYIHHKGAFMCWYRLPWKKEFELWNFKDSGSVPVSDILTGLNK